MRELSLLSEVSLYVLLAFIGLFTVLIWVWQVQVLKGKAMENPDGSSDDWHEQKTHYGIAFADLFLFCPLSIAGVVFVFFRPQWGYYLLALVSFLLVWGNMMTTATSLRFENPTINLQWIFTFPFGAFVGLAYLVWTVVHFDIIY